MPSVSGHLVSAPTGSARKRRLSAISLSSALGGTNNPDTGRPSQRSRPHLEKSTTTTNIIISRRPRELSDLPPFFQARIADLPTIPVTTDVAPPLTSSSGSDGHPGYVSRHFLAKVYGFSEQTFLHRRKSDAKPGTPQHRNVLFPQWIQNPGLPLEPGHPGTVLTMREDVLEAGYMALFVRAPSKALWLYMGEYKITAHPRPLSCLEFKALPRIVSYVFPLPHPPTPFFFSFKINWGGW